MTKQILIVCFGKFVEKCIIELNYKENVDTYTNIKTLND